MSLRVAYLLKSFPRLSETFILNEMLALRAQGVQVLVCALERSGESTMHPAAAALLPEVVWMDTTDDPTDPRVAAVPRKQRPAALAGLRVAARLQAWDARHLHAHFAGPAATAASRAMTSRPSRSAFGQAPWRPSSSASWPRTRRARASRSGVKTGACASTGTSASGEPGTGQSGRN